MKFTLLSAAALVAPTTALPHHPAQNPLDATTWPGHRIPTARESAVLGRRLLAHTHIADFASVYPASHPDPAIAGQPTSMMDYVADCEDKGNPTILKLDIGTTFRNAAAGSNVTVSLRWVPPYPPAKRMSISQKLLSWAGFVEASNEPDTLPYSAANLPRVSLMGYIEPISPSETSPAELSRCFVNAHPDAKYWLPGNPIHRASWARLVVEKVYWVGGFGDRAYIGWITKEDWEAVTEKEIEGVVLPGEKPGWSEWSVEM